ncbi:hypothetical protein QJS66_17605 [Kocuria rhizophila]|nr:hypothetical protein QJS66_17605 [Kocuria rhizophila]
MTSLADVDLVGSSDSVTTLLDQLGRDRRIPPPHGAGASACVPDTSSCWTCPWRTSPAPRATWSGWQARA